MSHPRTGMRSAAAARNDVLALLRGDHDRVLEEFREFERLESLSAEQACLRVVQRTFAELKVLAGVEQQLFYPAVQDAVAGTDLLDQSAIEHTRIQRLIDQLELVEPSYAGYRRRFHTLGEYVRRHVQDEEDELYPMLATASIDWERLYDEMTSRRAELAEDYGVADVPPPRRFGDEPAVELRLDARLQAELAAELEDADDEERELALEPHH